MTKISIGSQLKKARQKKEVTLAEVYQQTKIHPNVLTSLEEDTYDNILNPIYMKSFLKRYASYLGLDEKKILEEYSQLHGEPQPEGKYEKTPPGEDKPAHSEGENTGKEEEGPLYSLPKIRLPMVGMRLPSLDKRILAKAARAAAAFIGIVIALLIIIKAAAFVTGKISKGYSSFSERQREAREAAKIQKARGPQPSRTAPQAGPVKAEEPFVHIAAVSVKEGAPAMPPEKAQETTPVKPGPAKAEPVSVPAGESLKLTIRVTNDVWVQLKVDGKIIFQDVLKKGSAETWEAESTFEIWAGRAEAMYLNLNGIDLGVLGSGVEKGVVVTRDGIKR